MTPLRYLPHPRVLAQGGRGHGWLKRASPLSLELQGAFCRGCAGVCACGSGAVAAMCPTCASAAQQIDRLDSRVWE